MPSHEYVDPPIAQLLLHVKNPRFESEQANQREAMQQVINDEDEKLARLVADIARRGLNPSRRLIVRHNGNRKNSFIVLDGNRRITALKLLSEPTLLDSLEMPTRISNKLKKLAPREPIATAPCVVLTDDEAHHWLKIEHVPKQDGVSTLNWDTAAQHRFAGESPQLAIRDLVRDGGYLDMATKERIDEVGLSNIERVIKTQGVATLFGIDVKKGELKILESEEEVTAKLSLLISDMINTKKSVSSLYDKDARIKYVEDILKRPLPTKQANPKPNSKPSKPNKPKPTNVERKTLIPKDCVLNIRHPRLNRVYLELLKLDTVAFTNSAAVLLRVFIELSVDHFGEEKNLNFKHPGRARSCPHCNKALSTVQKDMTFAEKTRFVADYMESNGILTKHQTAGIKKLINTPLLDLHEYIHSKDLNPIPSELRLSFDNIRPFIEALWK